MGYGLGSVGYGWVWLRLGLCTVAALSVFVLVQPEKHPVREPYAG